MWGAGGAWIAGDIPAPVRSSVGRGLVRWAVRTTLGGLFAARRRDRDRALFAVLRPLEAIVWKSGGCFPTRAPLPDSSLWWRLGLVSSPAYRS